jgi:hypothetical protein
VPEDWSFSAKLAKVVSIPDDPSISALIQGCSPGILSSHWLLNQQARHVKAFDIAYWTPQPTHRSFNLDQSTELP